MAKKRNLSHGRSPAKVKRAKSVATELPLVTAEEDLGSDKAAVTAQVPLAGALPRSVLRTPPRTRAARAGASGLTTDYHYVLSDLRRIALIAAAIFVVLFGLTLVIK